MNDTENKPTFLIIPTMNIKFKFSWSEKICQTMFKDEADLIWKISAAKSYFSQFEGLDLRLKLLI